MARRERPAPQQRRRREGSLETDVSEMVDIQLRFGLEDMPIRIPRPHWQSFLDAWVINAEDVVLRSSYRKHETNIVLRGSYHAIYTVSKADPDRSIPVYNVIVLSEVRKKQLAKHGLP